MRSASHAPGSGTPEKRRSGVKLIVRLDEKHRVRVQLGKVAAQGKTVSGAHSLSNPSSAAVGSTPERSMDAGNPEKPFALFLRFLFGSAFVIRNCTALWNWVEFSGLQWNVSEKGFAMFLRYQSAFASGKSLLSSCHISAGRESASFTAFITDADSTKASASARSFRAKSGSPAPFKTSSISWTCVA